MRDAKNDDDVARMWRADRVTYVEGEFTHVVELSQGDDVCATVYRDASGVVRMRVYASDGHLDIPAQWLATVLTDAEGDLPSSTKGSGC
jgi:hypothetical protein